MKIMKKTFALAAAVSLVCLSSVGAMAANKLIVKDSTGMNDKFVVTDTGNVGIGGVSPVYPIHIVKSGDYSAASLYFVNPGRAEAAGTELDSPGVFLIRGNISTVNGGMPRSNDRLGFLSFGSTGKTASLIESYAPLAWTAASKPSYISFKTINPGSQTLTEKMRVTSSGATGIVQVNGGFLLNSASGKPVCTVALRGTFWVNQVAGGTASGDTLQVCVQLPSSTSFNWRTVTLAP